MDQTSSRSNQEKRYHNGRKHNWSVLVINDDRAISAMYFSQRYKVTVTFCGIYGICFIKYFGKMHVYYFACIIASSIKTWLSNVLFSSKHITQILRKLCQYIEFQAQNYNRNDSLEISISQIAIDCYKILSQRLLHLFKLIVI